MKHVPKQIIIGEITEYESFKQIKLGSEYAPYFISSCGRIFSVNNNSADKKYKGAKELKTRIRKDGYRDIRITYNSKKYTLLLHVLVAQVFVKNDRPKKYSVVNHLDGDKDNNLYLNLEWTTHSENTLHALRNGLFNHAKGEQVGTSIYSEDQIIEVCEMIMQNISIKDISNHTGIHIIALSKMFYINVYCFILYVIMTFPIMVMEKT